MSFVFDVPKREVADESTGERKQVDWSAYHAHIIDATKTATKSRSIPGVISGIISLGVQHLPDAEMQFNGNEEDEREVVAQFPQTYFKDGKDKNGKTIRLKCWPQRPRDQIALTVDFPQIIVDKGQFFGDSNPAPLRMLLNGEFSNEQKVNVVGKPFTIQHKKQDDGKWAFAKNSTLHKLAAACDILDSDGYFTMERIGELLGKSAQFVIRCYMKPSKRDTSKTFFTEEIALAGIIPEGLPVPELDSKYLYGINMHRPNDPDAVKQLRASIVNTIKLATDFDKSVVKQELVAQGKIVDKAPVPPQAPVADDDDEEKAPF